MRFTIISTLCLLLLLLGVPGTAPALDFNAFWLYRASGGDGRETRKEFQERYSLGVGPQLDWRPTHAITATAAVGYNRTQRDSGSGTATTTEITPSASLTLSNDIFSLGLAGDLSRYSGSGRETTTGNSWDASLSSRWDLPYWPSIRLNYGQRDTGEDTDKLQERSDQIQTTGSVAVNWDLNPVLLDYRFSTTLDENRETGDRTESDSHFVRGETGGAFWNNRLSFRLSQQYQTTDSDSLLFGELPVGGGIAKFDFLLPTDPGYRDPDTPDPDVPALEGPLPIHIQFRIGGFERRVDVVRLEYNVFSGHETPPLIWDLYLRDFAGVWEFAGVIVGTDNVDLGYVELPVGREVEELLLVSRDDALRLPPATAYRLFDQGDADSLLETASTTTSLLTNAGVTIGLTRTLRASINGTLEQLDGESVSILKTLDAQDQATTAQQQSQRRTFSGRLVWTPAPWVTPSLGYSETTEEGDSTQFGEFLSRTDSQRVNRTYSLTVATRPSTTVSVTFGVTRTENTSDESSRNPSDWSNRDRQGEGLQYSVTTSAQLYPDLTTSLFIAWSEREETAYEVRNGTDVPEETALQKTQSETFSIRSNFNARLRSDVTADLTTNFRNGKQQRWTLEDVDDVVRDGFPRATESSSTTADSTLVLTYRPSSYLSLRGFYTAYFLDSTQDPRMGGGLTLALLRTQKTRVIFDYTVVYVDELINSVGLNGSWNISRALSLQGRSNYTMSDTDFYSAQVSLNLRL